jgi:23S rRNA (cytidine2498-2'-O)-methyltransferase
MPVRLEAPTVGRWLWTCRAGFEPHLFEELAWQKTAPRLLGPALVESDAPRAPPVFARVGFPVGQIASQTSDVRLPAEPHTLQVWAPDTDVGHRFTALTQTIDGALNAGGRGDLLAQICVVDERLWAVGQIAARDALSLAPGCRHRMRREREAPSRAAMKLEEALEWLGVAPAKGEECVDLGAAPGGWTQRLVARGAKVIAVDPAQLTPELTRHPKVGHVQGSAFAFEPELPVDWLFCDMAWRPLEVAQLIGKWGRRRLANLFVANFKLPMNDKNATLHRIRHVLAQGNWTDVKLRQLYHDRDEVTATGVLKR